MSDLQMFGFVARKGFGCAYELIRRKLKRGFGLALTTNSLPPRSMATRPDTLLYGRRMAESGEGRFHGDNRKVQGRYLM